MSEYDIPSTPSEHTPQVPDAVAEPESVSELRRVPLPWLKPQAGDDEAPDPRVWGDDALNQETENEHTASRSSGIWHVRSMFRAESGLPTDIWLLSPPPEPHNEELEDVRSVTEVMIDRQPRLISSPLLRMATKFNASEEVRSVLKHDCAVFALACATGESYDDVPFHQPGGLRVAMRTDTLAMHDKLTPITIGNYLEPGQAVLTSGRQIIKGVDREIHHILIKASADEGRALYLSKFTSIGPVVLSSLETSMQIYPTKSVALASDFRAFPMGRSWFR